LETKYLKELGDEKSTALLEISYLQN